jgi:4-diphosphocytidyl-2-C-methyl-D-erythritol kinase
VIVFPNCKINLGLRILRKRNDGYHDLETVFYPLPFYDVLEIIRSDTVTSFTSTGLSIDAASKDNLCIKAYDLLKKDFPELPGVKIHLHKTIPTGAGLGGGSADAAFTLSLLNKKINLNLSTEQLINYALQLGSDCPFFIINQPCFAESRGEIFKKITLDLSDYNLVLVNPGIHVSTAEAFANISPTVPGKSIKEIIQQPITSWKNELINDFETTVFKKYPGVKNIKEELYNNGAEYASLSGSGSTVYGIFQKNINLQLSIPEHYFVKQLISQR